MVLARLLAPSVFGILASVQIVISLSDILADAGLQKYIVQKEFKDNREKEDTVLVAVYTNIMLGIILWLVICMFNDELAMISGCPGLGHVLIVAGLNIPIVSFSGVQLAVLKREFAFKDLLWFRLVTSFVPLFVTVPLAYIGFEYWALVAGMIFSQMIQGLMVYHKKIVKFRFFYSLNLLKNMLSFSLWSLLEFFFIWLTTWADTFFVSHSFSSHYLGVYKMSSVAVNSLLGIVTGAFLPVMFSALSRLNFDKNAFNNLFYKMQERLCLVILPLGFGLFAYSDLARVVLFGSDWSDAEFVIGINGVFYSLMMAYSYPCSEVYRSKGLPKLSTIAQFLYLLALLPIAYYLSYDFKIFVIMINAAKIIFIAIHFLIMYYVLNFNPIYILRNTFHYIIVSCVLVSIIIVTRNYFKSYVLDCWIIFFSAMLYPFLLSIFKDKRTLIKEMVKNRKLI